MRRKRREPTYLTEDERAAFFSVLRTARDKALFELAYKRGLRASEVGRLLVTDYDPKSKRLRVRRLKGSLSGEYRLTEREVQFLQRWLRERGPVAGPIFLGYRGRGISRRALDKWMKQFGQAAGLPPEKCHFHVLKHSCVTSLLEQGVDIVEVQDHVGHANIGSTMVYSHISSKRRSALADRLRHW